MELPDIKYDDLPEEMREVIPEDFEIDPLTPSDQYKPNLDPGRDAYINRKMIRTLDEYITLQKIHQNKQSSKEEKWQKVKKASRYYKSNLYAIKDLDRDPKTAYNDASFDEKESNDIQDV